MIEKYPDGSWWPNDHQVIERFPLMCRGNTGEVYPNIVSPLCGSIIGVPFGEGQRRAAIDAGFATRRQMVDFDGHTSALAANIAGYLYANVSLARSATARTPGLTVEVVDRQMYGLSGAPSYRRGPGDRSPVAATRAAIMIGGALLRPNDRSLRETQAMVEAFVAGAPDPATASNEQLLALPVEAADLLIRLMRGLILASAFAATGRSIVERLVVEQGGDGLVNQLTSGLGTIESAQPAAEMWGLGRLVAASDSLTGSFDAGPAGLHERLRTASDPDTASFRQEFSGFQERHGARGPDEWELASPTWGTDPSIALAVIDRLRRAPAERDPVAVGEQLTDDRHRLVGEVRAGLSRHQRRLFDIGLRAAGEYQAQREATKAAAVRLLMPIRLGLAELARRSAFSHDDFFLLRIDETRQALAEPGPFTSIVDERRSRRDYLQARVPPFWFEYEIPHPSTWELKADARRVDHDARVIHGLGVCSGSATGTARVVMDPTDPGDLEPGDILIAPITDPAWTPLFLAAAGVVVDVGAQMSHAAIVARELGIPAVVSATGASQTIPNGATVTVDGTAGTVTVH